MIILGVDLGMARTGIAICDAEQILATPVCVFETEGRKKLCSQIVDLCRERNVQAVVLGLPKNMDGSEGESAQNARAFAERLKKAGIEDVRLWDERCTTITAYHFLDDTQTYGKKRKAAVDAVAATIILQEYLDSLR